MDEVHRIELIALDGTYTATWIAGTRPLAKISFLTERTPEEIIDIFVQQFYRQGYEPTGFVVFKELRRKNRNKFIDSTVVPSGGSQ